ncbi:MAG: GTPase RsgA, partial [Myxococcales bacterium]|nr:GTPase RsgA [Myxococcales bacterium]
MRPASSDAIAASIVSRTSLGFGPFADAFDHLLRDRPDLVPARVTRVDRGRYRLAGAVAGVGELAGRLRHDLAGIDLPTVGDWVAIRDVDDADAVALVHHVLPRRTALIRRAAGLTGAAQVVAANLDVCFIVTSANRDANPRRLERYLTAVWDSGAAPVVVVNKIDLGGDVAALVAALAAVAPGVPIEAVSAVTGDGLAPLRAHLAAGPGGAVRTVGLVGSSGVGKSSLVNRLLGVDRQATAGLDDDERGRHTTTRRELVVLP